MERDSRLERPWRGKEMLERSDREKGKWKRSWKEEEKLQRSEPHGTENLREGLYREHASPACSDSAAAVLESDLLTLTSESSPQGPETEFCSVYAASMKAGLTSSFWPSSEEGRTGTIFSGRHQQE